MNSLARNKEICNYHFLNNMDAPKETETSALPLTLAATSQDATMVSACKEQKTCEQNEHQIKQEKMEEPDKSIEISEQRHELIEILIRKDSTIDNLSFELRNMEIRLQSAVTGKLDALARLEKIEGKEQTLLFKEKQMNLDMENRNCIIESLRDELNKNVAELTAARQELISASAQFEIDVKEMSEKLKIANLNIGELSQTNQNLKLENEKCAHKLREQFHKAGNLMKAYDDDLKAQTELAQLYKENSADYEAQIDELHDGVIELQRLLSETVDGYGVLETSLRGIEEDHSAESEAKDEVIAKMKQELKDANCLLKAYRSNDSDKNDTEDVAEEVNDLSCLADGPLTYTEVYSQWRSAAKHLQHKEQEYKTLQMEMTNLIEEIKEKAINFEKQQNELELHKAANHQLNEERNCFLVEKVVGREELESTRLQCELLKNENDKLKLFGGEHLMKFFSNHQPNENLAVASVAGMKSNTIELEQQKEQLLTIINNLMTKFHGMETSEISPNENVESVNQSTAISPGTSSTTTNICHCHEIGEGTKQDLMVADSQCSRSDIENARSQAENALLLEELKQDSHKLQNTIRELTAEKNLLLAEQNLCNLRYNFCKEQIKSLHRQNQNMVEERTFANQYLRDENANVSMKLSTTQDQLIRLEEQHRSLCHVKSALVVEVETLQQELVHERVANKTHRYEIEMKKKSLDQMKIELQMRTADNSDCRVIVNRLERSVENLSQNISKLSTDEAVQTDFANGCDADISSEIMDDFSPTRSDSISNSLQLVKLAPPKLTSRKRKSQSAAASSSTTFCPRRLRPKKLPRISFVDLSEDSDEETDINEEADINVCDIDSGPDLPNIELQYLSEVRTRKQAKFILDAFNSHNLKCSVDEKADRKASKPKSTRRSNRSRSSGGGQLAANVQVSRRSRSAGNQQSTRRPNVVPFTINDRKVSEPKPKRRRSSKRSRSYGNGPSHGTERISSHTRSSTCEGSAASRHQPSDQKSNVDRQHPLPAASGSNPPNNRSEITTDLKRRSHRLMSRYRRRTEGLLK